MTIASRSLAVDWRCVFSWANVTPVTPNSPRSFLSRAASRCSAFSGVSITRKAILPFFGGKILTPSKIDAVDSI